MCRFWKVHSVQQYLFRLLHSWQTELNKSDSIGIIQSTWLLPCDPLIAKVKGSGLDEKVWPFILICLNNHNQRTTINTTFSDWHDSITCVSKRSNLVCILFQWYFLFRWKKQHLSFYVLYLTFYSVAEKNCKTYKKRYTIWENLIKMI